MVDEDNQEKKDIVKYCNILAPLEVMKTMVENMQSDHIFELNKSVSKES